jgi:hypothetical protein
MRLTRVQFRIRWLMVAVAISAVLLFLLTRIHVLVVVAVTGMALVVVIPAALAPRGRRLEVAGWAASFQPFMVLVYLYATWITAWCVLGHRPRPSLDDPKSISPIVDVPRALFYCSLEFGAPISLVTGLILAGACYARRSAVSPLLILPFAWLAAYAVLVWDPLRVAFWYMD